MSIFSISFAILGLAFMCESANAIVAARGLLPGPSSQTKGVEWDTSDTEAKGGWFCTSKYYYDSTTKTCLKLPDNAHETVNTGFECNSTFVLKSDRKSCVCPQGFYFSNSKCNSLIDNAQADATSSTGWSCKSGYSLTGGACAANGRGAGVGSH